MDIRNTLKGWRTVVASRFVWLCGALVAAHDYLLPFLVSTDLTPISQRVSPLGWLMITIGLGILFDFLRHITDTQIGQKQ